MWRKALNDFTKAELNIIYINLCVNAHTKEVFKKLGEIIDNYCEHECSETRDINCIKACPTCGEHHDN